MYPFTTNVVKGDFVQLKLSDSEIAIMQILWMHGETRATEVADIAKEQHNWEKNTSYTFLHRLIKKGAVVRRDPGFFCVAAYEQNELMGQEAREMVGKLYSGSIGQFVSAFFDGKAISDDERAQLQKLIDESK